MRSVGFYFLIFVSCANAKETEFLPALEEELAGKFIECVGYGANWLQSFNDEHLGKTAIGRFLRYDEMKTQMMVKENPSEGRSTKKMGMAMMPLVFHIGATSTWMLITTLLAAKSLGVGLLLLVFKIAVSSAKLASFFTHLKHSKHAEHHDWAPTWTPQYEHHDSHIEHHPEHGTIPHHPAWIPNDTPQHFYEYKNEISDSQKNSPYDHYDTDFNSYNTIPHETHACNDGFYGDSTHFDGAKKKIDAKVG